MLALKKLPLFSLAILLVTYSILGWRLSRVHSLWFTGLGVPSSWVILLLVVAGALLIAISLTSALPIVTDIIGFTLKSDTRAFLVVSVGAFLTVLIICWLPVFAHILIVVSANSLARLDLQTLRFSQWQAFLILSIVSLAGLGLGWVAHTII